MVAQERHEREARRSPTSGRIILRQFNYLYLRRQGSKSFVVATSFAGLLPLRVVHSAHPVHGNIRLPSIQEIRRAERRALAVRFKNHDSEGREDA